MSQRPRSDYSYWDSFYRVTATVLEETPDFQPTGLLDRHGVPLYRPKPPMGFTDFSKLRTKR